MSAACLLVAGLCAACGFHPSGRGLEFGLSVESRMLLEELDDAQTAQRTLRGILTETFGTPTQPRVPTPLADLCGVTSSLASAADTYRRQCMHCHGLEGGGDGSNSLFLSPRPSDLRLGKFKWTSVLPTHAPLDADIARTLARGIPFTSMPSFASLSVEKQTQLVDYVRWLSMRGQVERLLVYEAVADPGPGQEDDWLQGALDQIHEYWATPAAHILNPGTCPEADEMDEERVLNGERLFHSQRTQCAACHGADLDGKGPAVYEVVRHTDGSEERRRRPDEWGNPSIPRDLRRGGFRGGESALDLFRRIRGGIPGTIMPAAADEITDDEVWDLVYYVLTAAGLHEAAAGKGAARGADPKVGVEGQQ